MLNEMLLTTTLCVAIVGAMALFYDSLLQHGSRADMSHCKLSNNSASLV